MLCAREFIRLVAAARKVWFYAVELHLSLVAQIATGGVVLEDSVFIRMTLRSFVLWHLQKTQEFSASARARSETKRSIVQAR
jgi:hypothetical protein